MEIQVTDDKEGPDSDFQKHIVDVSIVLFPMSGQNNFAIYL